MAECIFCKIINKSSLFSRLDRENKASGSEIVFEDDTVAAFNDINPKAPVHILIVPKKHIPSINNLESEDEQVVGHLFSAAKMLAKEKGVAESGYRLSINVGRDAGQEVDHLHLHLLGGRKIPLA